MTTIAWDGITLAADRMGKSDGGCFSICKIRKCADGRLIGGAGLAGAVTAYLDWLELTDRGPIPAFQLLDDDCVHALEIMHDGRVFRHERFASFQVLDKLIAVGSGSSFALGAMHAGACAKKAILITSNLHSGTGMGVDTLRLA